MTKSSIRGCLTESHLVDILHREIVHLAHEADEWAVLLGLLDAFFEWEEELVQGLVSFGFLEFSADLVDSESLADCGIGDLPDCHLEDSLR